jgi:dihydrofolate reductase
MGKLVVSGFVSVDGVFQDPGGVGEIDRGGWSFKAEHGDDFNEFKFDELMAADAQLLGRTTYEGFAKVWPEMGETEGEFAVKMNKMSKHLVSKGIENPTWENTTVVRENVEDGLIDELRLMIFPIIVGDGKHLFDGQRDMTELRPKDSKVIGPDGIIVLNYVPA